MAADATGRDGAFGGVDRGRIAGRLVFAAGVGLALAGCTLSNPLARGGAAADTAAGETAAKPASSVKLVDRDTEAPEAFQATDSGLWDGRPSLGGVWVAYPDVKDPERVIIRNPANGKFVIGALFRRERDLPGPKMQVSSDAAAALGMLAGAPASLQVTALRREETPEAAAATPGPAAAAPAAGVAATAAAAIDKAEGKPAAGAKPAAPSDKAADKPAAKPADKPAAASAAAPAAATAAPAKTSGRPFLQIGIFSVEANANRAVQQMKAAGLAAETRKDESQGKTFWRVVVGPLASDADRAAAVAKVKGLGYPDAYAVSR
jgi:cell division septation protein DedD